MAQIQPSEKQFWKYVLPSMLTMLLGGFYGIVDGFFIGNAVGDDGLAAINLAWPLTALILATGTGLGVGGSVLMSIRNGEGRTQAANQAKGGALLLLAIVSVVFTLLFSLSAAQIMRFFGAEGHVLKLCVDYIQIIVYGTALQIFGVGLTPILRNTGRTVQAMVMMISGFATNIVLDWLFIMVFEWQLGGAALATIIGQGVVAVFSLIILVTDKQLRPTKADFKADKKTLGSIVRIGLSPFGSSLAPSVVIMFCNWQCIRYGGNPAVAAYSVLSYLSYSANSLMAGVGQGIQPIISYANGAKAFPTLLNVRRKALKVILALSVLLFLAAIPAQTLIAQLFGLSSTASLIFARSLWIASFAFPFMGIVKLGSEFFCAINKTRYSTILIYGDPLLLSPLFLMSLPLIWHLDGVWLAMPFAQGLIACMALLMFHRYDQRMRYIINISKKEAVH